MLLFLCCLNCPWSFYGFSKTSVSTPDHCYFLAYQTSLSSIFAVSDTSNFTNPFPKRGIDKNEYNTCCKYVGCIEGNVTTCMSLRCWELTSLRRNIRLQFSILRTSTWPVNGDSYVNIKIRRYARKRIYHSCLLRIKEKHVHQDNCVLWTQAHWKRRRKLVVLYFGFIFGPLKWNQIAFPRLWVPIGNASLPYTSTSNTRTSPHWVGN